MIPPAAHPLLDELRGGYPALQPARWLGGYALSYIKADVRQINRIHDLALFQRFVKLCANRTGHLLNLTNLAQECGIDMSRTLRKWLQLAGDAALGARLVCTAPQSHVRDGIEIRCWQDATC